MLQHASPITITEAERRVYWPSQPDLVVTCAALARVLCLACEVGPRGKADGLALLAMADVLNRAPHPDFGGFFGSLSPNDLADHVRATVESMRSEWEVIADGAPNDL